MLREEADEESRGEGMGFYKRQPQFSARVLLLILLEVNVCFYRRKIAMQNWQQQRS